MTEQNDALGKLLSTDPLAEAEKATGKSYKSDEVTLALGMLAHMNNVKVKKEALKASGDTFYGSSWKETEKIIEDLGFEQILVRPFLVNDVYAKDKKNRLEYLVFYWHADGILMKAETYGGEHGSTNSIHLYYNVEFVTAQEAFANASSGHLHRESYDAGRFVWIGHHQIQEGLRYKLNALREVGEFLPVWLEDPFLYLQHYGEKDHMTVAETLALFPQKVQDALTVVDRTKPHYNKTFKND